MDATGRFLRRQLWAWPVIAALIIGGAGLWVNSAIESALREQRVATLTTILKADVEALRTWMGRQEQSATLLTDHSVIRQAVHDLITPDSGQPPDPKAIDRLREWLAPRLKANGYIGFFLVRPDGTVVAADHDLPQGKPLSGYRKEYFDSVLAGKPAVSKPYRSPLLLMDEKGQLKTGSPTMLVAAPIHDEQGKRVAAIVFRIRPEADFTRILQTAQAGQSGETYAFDRNGLMLSQSRFDDQMKQVGLLVDDPDVKSVLTLQLRDPGVNLVEGGRARMRRAEMPTTRAVQEAVANGEGYDVDGYPDYRGVPVLGAWVWLPDYDFGVVTEVDQAEALRPVYILRGALAVLIGLLLAVAIALFGAMWFMARQQTKLRAAVLEARQLGQYTLEEKLGAGGMGTVYKARHAMLRRPTAVKLLNVTNMSDVAVARFEREVQMTSGLTHPNTVAIYDYGRTPEGLFYYAMEYMEGVNLEDLVAKYGPLPEARVLHLLRQACGSLAEAHAAGMVHRDVTPANIFLTRRGGMCDFVKVLDFGLVKVTDSGREANLTATNAVTGTPYYLSPEGINTPDQVGPPADVYALGAVAYYLLTGTPVFTGESVMEICMKQIRDEPIPPSARGARVSPALEQIILRCLAKSPTDRPPTAAAMLLDLDECPVVGRWTTAQATEWWINPSAHRSNPTAANVTQESPEWYTEANGLAPTADNTQAFVPNEKGGGG